MSSTICGTIAGLEPFRDCDDHAGLIPDTLNFFDLSSGVTLVEYVIVRGRDSDGSGGKNPMFDYRGT